jgi:NitT/TauT family transport system permease protein
MSEPRPTPRWVPILAVAALIALASLFVGPARVLRLAQEALPLERGYRDLPAAALGSLLRMASAYVFSLAFAWWAGVTAATRPGAARILLPLLDVGQSVPVLGFFPAAIALFIGVLGGGRMSLELAAVFLIITSQVWNLAFAIYEGLSTIPAEMRAASESLGVKGVLLWRALYLPACIPTLIYNSILSWANGWYFLIACEIIVAGRTQYELLGLGSMLSQALARGDIPLAIAALAVLIAIVISMELFIWRPLRSWSRRFAYDSARAEVEGAEPEETLRLPDFGLPALIRPLRALGRAIWSRLPVAETNRRISRLIERLGRVWRWLRWPTYIVALLLGVSSLVTLGASLLPPWPAEASRLPLALLLSFLRINVAYLLALLWIVPVALWVSDHPRTLRPLNLIAQVGASIPATAFFPVLVALLVDRFGGMEAISILLALTGMQSYLLFNALAGVQRVPQDLRESMRSLGLSRQEIHRRLVLPACMPALVTGSVVAWGGTWNAQVLSEYVVYRHRTYQVLGVGAMLNEATFVSGSRTLLMLSVAALVVTVVMFNRLVWKPIFEFVHERYRLEVA